MYSVLLVVAVVLSNLVAGENKSKHVDTATNTVNHVITNTATKNNVASHHNITYIEKAENMLRTPNIKKFYEEHKKKKKPKKTPKRTIQKIIKNNRGKVRKVFFSKRANPTTSPPKIDYEKLYMQDENMPWREEKSTTQGNQRRKSKRKYTPKQSGYHMPFQKLHKKDHRHKREVSRELHILRDLDEMQFLSNPYKISGEVVRAHVKNYW